MSGGVSANAPNALPGQQDFIKGWPHPSLLNTEHLKTTLSASMMKAMESSTSILNYGDSDNGAHMLGHPEFRSAMGEFLSKSFPDHPPCPAANIMSTGGSSMGTDLIAR